MRVVFLGSPLEVVSPLEALWEKGPSLGFDLIAVVTQPPKPRGRGKQVSPTPVGQWARDRGVPYLEPLNAKDSAFIDELRSLNVDVAVTAAYGQILSDEFLAVPKRATINIHPSLLPQYRGATPVPAALLDGLTKTGVTVLFTVKKLDAGALIVQKTFEMGEKDAGQLTHELFKESGGLLLEALTYLKDPQFVGVPQDESLVTYCRKIQKEDGLLNWKDPIQRIWQTHRAFSPWPGTFSFLKSFRVKWVKLKPLPLSWEKDERLLEWKRLGPGAFGFQKELGLLVAGKDGVLVVDRVCREGSKEQDGRSFWNGLRPEQVPFVAGSQLRMLDGVENGDRESEKQR